MVSGRYLGVDPGLVQSQQLLPRLVNVAGVPLDPFNNHGERALLRLVPNVDEHVQGLHELGDLFGVHGGGHGVLRKIEHQYQR